MGPEQVLPLRVRVDLGVMAMKVYSTFLRDPGLEPYYLLQFSDIIRIITRGEITSFLKGHNSCYLITTFSPMYLFSLVYLFNGISTDYDLSNAEIWFISKYLSEIITIFSMFQSIFLKLHFYLSTHYYDMNYFNLIQRISIQLIGWVLWQINHCGLFNAESSLYIYIKYIWFGLVGFYGKSTIVGYLMPNPLYTYILNI